jgi:integrase
MKCPKAAAGKLLSIFLLVLSWQPKNPIPAARPAPRRPRQTFTVPAARHTCATLVHLQGVPVVVIAAWIGHKDANLTLQLYAHSQSDALKAAGATLNRVVETS